MKMPASRATLAGLTAVVACLALWGCPNPNSIGVQQYGIVVATCVQASNSQPVSGAQVTVAGVTSLQPTDSSGKTSISQVPIGTHLAVADAPGLHGEASVPVVENQTAQVRITMSPTQ